MLRAVRAAGRNAGCPSAFFVIVISLLGAASSGCETSRRDPRAKYVSAEDTPAGQIRRAWVHDETASRNWYLRDFLNGIRDIEFFDGWYDPEFDQARSAAWRWMERRGIIRLRTRIDGQADFQDMALTVHGWLPSRARLGPRGRGMEFAVNGRVLAYYAAPEGAFEYTLRVPKELLTESEFVDFAITVANAAPPSGGDWRDLGFCTTGVVWKPSTAS
jgi:hypothetical protein